jgi:transcriptional accessory protein Tex/SPT6
VVSVGDIVTVYVVGIDEARGRVQLSLLPPDALATRSANRSKPRDDRRKQQKKNGQKPQQSKKKEDDYTYEDAMKKLLERFGKQR